MPLIGRIAAATARGYGLFANVVQAVDPFFNYVVALLHGDGTNGGQNNTFLDSSSNNFTITRNGNTTQGSFSPFSQTGWSGYFDGSGDYCTLSSNASMDFGAGNFTIECFVNTGVFSISAGASRTIIGNSGNSYTMQLYIETGSGKVVFGNTGSTNLQGTGTVADNQWHHIVVVRSGTGSNQTALFIDGQRQAVGTNSQNYSSGTIYLGAFDTGNGFWNGYISNLRIVKGTAVYDPTATTLTVPTTPLTAVSNTALLTLQSNRFLDNSTNAYTVTKAGDTSIQPFSPFNPTTPYSTSAVGGSGYFDGAGDFLQVADAAPMELGSGNWTIEMWVNTTNNTAYSALFGRDDGAVTAGSYVILLNGATANGIVSFYSADINAFSAAVLTSGTTSCRDGAWHHIAIVRNSNTLTMYIDGTSTSTATFSGSFANTAQPIKIGSETGYSRDYTGYISNVRLVVGTAVYTSNFTPPTAPLTAITNTQLLLNFTNGAIFDNAAVADYETVGNAQISTSVKKYGTGSLAFDGTGDYLVTYAPSTDMFAFGTGDFTVEFWYYSNNSGVQQILYDSRPSGTNGAYITFYKTSGNVLELYVSNAVRLTGTTTLSSGVWYHVALCRVASRTKIFVNGTQSGPTYADTTAYLNGANRPVIGSDSATIGNLPINGYIDDLRISKGIGRYLYNFTPPTAEFPNIGGTVTLTADPYFDYTTLLLPGNGTNGAQNNTFLDSSTNAFTITRNGNTTQGTFSPFSQTGWGNFFDGTSDSLTFTATSAVSLTGAFTIEFWIYLNSTALDTINPSIITFPTQPNAYQVYVNSANTYFAIYNGSSDVVKTANGSATLNQWNHIAISRDSSNNLSIFLNGSRSATTASGGGTVGTSTGTFRLMSYDGSTGDVQGYLSNLRIVKGTAVYDPTQTSFTVPTTPLTAISGTSLLTCQSNRFIDNSTNAFAITAAGNVSVQAFSPFNPTAAWSAATYGGSGYFDGSGDFLTSPASSALDLSTGDWTIQGWYYPTAYSAGNNVLAYVGTSGSDKIVIADISTGGSGLWYLLNGSGVITSSTKAPLNAWSFFALVKSGSTTTLYLNGVSLGTTTSVPTSSNKSLNLGSDAGGAPYQGYMADFRILKGTANTAVPTAPLTAIANTSLLLNFTNAGIFDATSNNDLETVGNAQISTTQSKFGGSSMYFDGTGDCLLAQDSPNLNYGSGDFTAEAWVYPAASPNQPIIVGQWDGAGGGTGLSWVLLLSNDSNRYLRFALSTNGSGVLTDSVSSSALTLNAWNHVALVRYGSVFTAYLNGVSAVTYTISAGTALYDATNRISVGSSSTNTQNFNGYIDDLRITKGIARYTSNFTPPTAAFLTL